MKYHDLLHNVREWSHKVDKAELKLFSCRSKGQFLYTMIEILLPYYQCNRDVCDSLVRY